jgi:hypothetical protein
MHNGRAAHANDRAATPPMSRCNKRKDWDRRIVLGFERFLDRYGDVSFPDFAGRMKCSACGSRNVEVRPSWAAHS